MYRRNRDLLIYRLAGAALIVAASGTAAVAQERDRAKVADQYKWNLAEIYPSEEAWRTAKDRLVS